MTEPRGAKEKEPDVKDLGDEIARLNREVAQLQKENEDWKNKFLSRISHDFKTPLATLKLTLNYLVKYMQRLDQDAIDEKLSTALQQIDYLTHSVDNLLALKKGDKQNIVLTKGLIDVRTFFEKLIDETEKKFSCQGSILFHIDISRPSIETDEDLLRDIFSNLLTNAIKFSGEPANVWVIVRGSKNSMEVEVKDQGIGIDESEMPRIFESFFRGKSAKGKEGLGLGLFIVKRCVQILNGEIKVSSKPGQGTTFLVTVPNQYE